MVLELSEEFQGGTWYPFWVHEEASAVPIVNEEMPPVNIPPEVLCQECPTDSVSIILLRKVCPGGTTLAVNDKRPIRD